VVVAGAFVLAGCSGGAGHHPAPEGTTVPGGAAAPGSPTAPGPTAVGPGGSSEVPGRGTGTSPAIWLIGDAAVAALRLGGMSPTLVASVFDTPRTLLISNGGRVDAGLPNASPVRSFTSFADLQAAFAAGSVPATVKYVLYDNERWAFTPTVEQQQPMAYAKRAAAVAHDHGMKLIFAPAVNLATVAGGQPGSQRFDEFVRLGLAGQAAQSADVVELQAQQAIGTPQFERFVSAAAAQARAANPGAVVLVGLSTNPAGRAVSVGDLLDAYRLSRPLVDGYWLNIPARSPYCPSCGDPRPQVAVGLLQGLAGTGG